MISIVDRKLGLGWRYWLIQLARNVSNLDVIVPVFEKVLNDDESTTYQSKLRIRLVIVHICIRHTLTTITFKNDYTNNTKITVEMDLSCPEPASFQMVFFSEVG